MHLDIHHALHQWLWCSFSRLRKWQILGTLTYILSRPWSIISMVYIAHFGMIGLFWTLLKISPWSRFTTGTRCFGITMHNGVFVLLALLKLTSVFPSFTPTLVFNNSLKASLNWNRSLDKNIGISNATLLQPLPIAFWRTFSLLSMLWLIFGIYLKHLRFQMKCVMNRWCASGISWPQRCDNYSWCMNWEG